MWDDRQFAYSAKSEAVILNRNRFSFRLYSANQLGKKAYVVRKKRLKWTPVNITATTQLKEEQNCLLSLHSTEQNQYSISGCMPYGKPYYKFSVAVHNPRYLLKQTIQAWLQRHNITLQGNIIAGSQPLSTQILANHNSKPLVTLLKHMLVTSDNLYANGFFKKLGAVFEDGQGNWQNGQEAVLTILQSIGIDTNQINIVDGAGLSRYNKFSPQTLADIISYNHQHPATGQYFFKSLAISGVRGTLKHFLLGAYTGDFAGKTGSMTYVASVAGTLSGSHHPLAVIVMINGAQKENAYFSLIHNIIYRLAQISTK
jgi:D-alanyl-D-alanine carboxypeptidase/D-alanyl-D-alanine-endopeptidase (penicillin-binding protein 4)